MNHIQAKRLLKLARYLYAMPVKEFNYGEVIRGSEKPKKNDHCGTVGCAIGWTPMVFPKHFGFQIFNGKVALLYRGNSLSYVDENNFIPCAQDFFGLDHRDTHALFVPGEQYLLGEECLWADARPKQVARLFQKFLRKRFPNMDLKLKP